MLAIDFAKAFDRITYFHILTAAARFQVPLNTLKWLMSYLSNRLQRVHGNDGKTSSWISVTSGVPQGSVIGPLLFAIYIDSITLLFAGNDALTAVLYADNLTVLEHVRLLDSSVFQCTINSMCKWSDANKLAINASKCRSFLKNALVSLVNGLWQKIVKTATWCDC